MTPLIPMAILISSLAAGVAVPAAVQRELHRALVTPNGWAKVSDYRPTPADCQIRRAQSAPIQGSGTVAVRFYGDSRAGTPCDGWAWARVQVFAKVLVTTRKVAAAEPLAGALASEDREILPWREPVAELPEAAVAARNLPAGTMIEASQVRGPGPALGQPVLVLARAGGITLELPARVAQCVRGRSCAVLPSGKRVEGRFEAGRLVVEDP